MQLYVTIVCFGEYGRLSSKPFSTHPTLTWENCHDLDIGTLSHFSCPQFSRDHFLHYVITFANYRLFVAN